MTGCARQKCGSCVFAGWTCWAPSGWFLAGIHGATMGLAHRDHGITRKVTEAVTGGLKGP
jgi:hypothetical protein